EQRDRHDKSIRGYKKLMKENPELARKETDLIIKNTYRTLMTRGMKGCYVFCTDEETARYFRGRGGR
ncbi:DNA/RNA helicase domain-containing protein, partial [Pseudomonas aeruginosa]